MNRLFAGAIMLLAAASCATTPPPGLAAEEAMRARGMREAIEQRQFGITVDMAHTARGQAIPLTPDFELEIRGDSVFSYLPYFGRAYSVPQGGGSGLDFDSRMTQYTVRRMDKGLTRVEFRTRTNEDLYKYRIDVYDNGRATVSVSAMQRDRIRFDGEFAH